MKKLFLLVLICFIFIQAFPQKDVAIYWDASYSMKDRQLDKELEFLDNYFKKFTNVNVKLTVFSNDIVLEDNFTVVESNWHALMNELKATVYDGATSYSGLFKDEADEYLLFTDGIENIDGLSPPFDTPIHFITSVEDINMNKLKTLSSLSSGRFFYLNPEKSESSDRVQLSESTSNIEEGFITGNVSGVEGNLPNVSIVNQSNSRGVATDSKGDFRIKADEGDVLIFSFLGKKTVSIRVGKFNVVDVTMTDINQSLDEVVLTAEQQEAEFVNTGNVKVDKRRLGYDVEEITADQISDQDIDLIGAVKGQFSNLEIQNDIYNNTDISKFLGRGKNMSILLNQYGLIVVDGVPLAQSESNFGGLSFSHDNMIDPSMISSISYLKGLAATNKYGTLGRNGVLLITTKNAEVTASATENTSTMPLGTTDTYIGTAEAMNALPNTPYINALKNSKSVNEAFGLYLQQREQFGNDYVFYIDMADYFNGWNNTLITERILSNIYELSFSNTEALKALAYKQQQNGFLESVVATQKRLIELNPGHSQPYRDLALALSDIGNQEEALDIYKNIDALKNVGNANFQGIKKTVTNEARSLIALNKKELNTTGVNPLYMRSINYRSRIVFEWNNLDAQFDLNIVNPQNRFFTWSHTNTENSQNILQQKQQGFGLEEFYLTQDDVGQWKFNVKYYGNGTDQPTFVKITTYKNFGLPNQTKQVKVVRLNKTDVEQTVTNLMVSN